MSELHDRYKNEIMSKLRESGGYKNDMEIPRLSKITLSTGIGSGKDRSVFDEAIRVLGEITGQRPVIAKARTNVAGFKLRKGNNVGVFVTLRGKRMYDFFMRLINVGLPRVRDFRGLSPKSFDGGGNYSMGIADQSIFTEVNLDKMKHAIGMNIAVVTTAKTDNEGRELLTLLGVPFKS